MKVLHTGIRVFEQVFLGIAGLCIAVVAVLVFIDVMSRFILQKSIGWLQTLDQWLILGSSFLIVGVLLRTGDHVRVDMLSSRLRGAAHKAIMTFNYTMVLVFGIVTTWSGVRYVDGLIERGVTRILYSYVPLWTVVIVVPIGMAVLVIYAIGMIVKTLLYDSNHND
jgi:TRAP-type C4-dicarboxylate transport system permease small subunit